MGGAVEKRWFLLGQEFARQGHEVVHISRCYGDLPVSEVIEGVQHLRVSGFATPKRLVVLKALDLLYTLAAIRKLPKADILVSNTFWLPVLCRKPAAGKIYVDVARVPRGQMRFYTNAGAIRACSRAIEQYILQELNPAYHHLVTYVPNPFPFNARFSESDIPLKNNEIVFVGRVHPEKGLSILIDAINSINSCDIKDWKLKIFGPSDVAAGGGGNNYLKSLLLKLKDHNRISFEGPVYDVKNLRKVYESAAIMVYPTIAEKGEAAPLAPREAMACGCVPVVSDIPQFSDLIVDGQNGLLFDWRNPNSAEFLADKLLYLMRNRETREMMAKRALEVQDTHSITAVAESFLQDFMRINTPT